MRLRQPLQNYLFAGRVLDAGIMYDREMGFPARHLLIDVDITGLRASGCLDAFAVPDGGTGSRVPPVVVVGHAGPG